MAGDSSNTTRIYPESRPGIRCGRSGALGVPAQGHRVSSRLLGEMLVRFVCHFAGNCHYDRAFVLVEPALGISHNCGNSAWELEWRRAQGQETRERFTRQVDLATALFRNLYVLPRHFPAHGHEIG